MVSPPSPAPTPLSLSLGKAASRSISELWFGVFPSPPVSCDLSRALQPPAHRGGAAPGGGKRRGGAVLWGAEGWWCPGFLWHELLEGRKLSPAGNFFQKEGNSPLPPRTHHTHTLFCVIGQLSVSLEKSIR